MLVRLDRSRSRQATLVISSVILVLVVLGGVLMPSGHCGLALFGVAIAMVLLPATDVDRAKAFYVQRRASTETPTTK